MTIVLTAGVAVLAPDLAGWSVLMIRRGTEPFLGRWAVPGGKVEAEEDTAVAAVRELQEETGILLSDGDLMPLGCSESPSPDSRIRFLSCAYVALLPSRPTARAASDADETRWWPLTEIVPSKGRQASVLLAFDHGDILSRVRRAAPRDTHTGPCLRRVTDSDIEAVLTLHHETLGYAGIHAGPGPWADDLENPYEHYVETGGEFLVGVLGTFLISMGGLRRIGDHTAQVKRMRVHPRWQRLGHGRALVEHLEKRAQRLGFTRLLLDAPRAQKAALALYTSRGFQITSEAVVAGMPCVLMEKHL
jgi:ADP-ribose pyrophosphatase YjhB (NUDIX family)/ribosomal protein S18 acetylase RimI-like enzyme